MNNKMLLAATLVLGLTQIVTADSDTTLTELDAVWAELPRTVAEGDFSGMAAMYHEDAVLVNSISGTSYPIAVAMQGWKPDIERTRSGQIEATVSFRFSQRVHGDDTAHETGMFYYTAKPSGGELSEAIINFEALLVKKNGDWKVIMEYQKSVATPESWSNLWGRIV